MKEAIAKNDKQTLRFHGLSCRDVAIAFRVRGQEAIFVNKTYGNVCFLSVFFTQNLTR
jgi:hypothetical protein